MQVHIFLYYLSYLVIHVLVSDFLLFHFLGDRGKAAVEEEVDVDNDSSDEAFVPDWSVKRGS